MWRAWLVALAVSTTACPWGDDDSGDRTLTVDELPGAYRSAACSYLGACGEFPDRATCLSANLPHISEALTFDLDPYVVAAMRAGRIQLDVARASSCLAHLASMSCDRTDRDRRDLVKQCLGFWNGTLPADAPCFDNTECISQYCAGGSTRDTCVVGTCIGNTPPSRELSEIGQPCASFPGCVDGAFCDFADTFTCLPLRHEGDACVNADECDYGLACAGDNISRYCTALPVLGEPCPLRECRDAGTYCAGTAGCKAIGLEGDACSGSFFDECAEAFPCDPSAGKCTRAPGAGHACAVSGVRCFDRDLVCETASVTCIERRADGQPCSVDAVCASGHCNTLVQQCGPAPMCF
jgi:hypothetical protein